MQTAVGLSNAQSIDSINAVGQAESLGGPSEETSNYKSGCEGAVRILKMKHAVALRMEKQLASQERTLSEKNAHCSRLEEKVQILSRALFTNSAKVIEHKPFWGSPFKKKVSIIIPVKNEVHSLANWFDALKKQKHVESIEVVVADSGSTDGTIEAAQSFGAKVLYIEPGSFNHGKTRMLAGHHANGAYFVFTVADALPSSDLWLYKIATTLETNPSVSALSVRQTVTPQADLYSQIKIPQVYETLGFCSDIKYQIADGALFDLLDPSAKRRFSYLDDVCSCMPRETFHRFGFNPLRNAEDIDLGVRLARSGNTLAFMHSSPIYHWHERDAAYFLKRSYLGVEAGVKILGTKLPCLKELHLETWENVACRCVSLYEAVKLSITRWTSSDTLRSKGLVGFTRSLMESIQILSTSHPSITENSLADTSLEELLPRIFSSPQLDTSKAYEFRTNHLLMRFCQELNTIATFWESKRVNYDACSADIFSVFYKTVGSLIGEALGTWSLAKDTAHGSQLGADLDQLLARGVCYT